MNLQVPFILSLSTGFKIQIDKFQRDALSEFPIIISQNTMDADKESLEKYMEKRLIMQKIIL